MHTVIIWSIALLLLTNVITFQIAWRRGIKNGEKWEKYRQETKVKIDDMPYGDRFRKDLNLNPADWPSMMNHKTRRRKASGQWTDN